MVVGDTFQLEYCPKVQFKLKRIDKQTKNDLQIFAARPYRLL